MNGIYRRIIGINRLLAAVVGLLMSFLVMTGINPLINDTTPLMNGITRLINGRGARQPLGGRLPATLAVARGPGRAP